MLIKNRNYTKVSRNLSAKKIYLFVEGKKREYEYFTMFGRNSKIEVITYHLGDGDDNTATGLYQIAKNCFKATSKKDIISCEGDLIRYDLDDEIDEVWIVIDADINQDKIIQTQDNCKNENNWNLVSSNPCFEVWLYYHFSEIKLTPEMLKEKGIKRPFEKCQAWKQYVNEMHAGGFNSKRDVKLINKAIVNSQNNYQENDNIPEIASTQVFRLAANIYQLVQEKNESRKRQ